MELQEPFGHSSHPDPPPFTGKNSDFEDLDFGWSKHSETLGMATLYGLISVTVFVIRLFLPSVSEPLFEILISLDWGVKVILALTGTYGVVLFSLFLQAEVSKEKKMTRRCLQLFIIGFYVLSFNIGGTYEFFKGHILLNYMQPFALGFYGLLVVMFRWCPKINSL